MKLTNTNMKSLEVSGPSGPRLLVRPDGPPKGTPDGPRTDLRTDPQTDPQTNPRTDPLTILFFFDHFALFAICAICDQWSLTMFYHV